MAEKNKYYGIDWLRTVACFGIVMMHMLSKDNNSYEISGFIFDKVIPSFADFVFLFMSISSFGMCCGYLEKVVTGRVNWSQFYKKRYLKILPFFALLIFIDLIMEFSIGNLYESIANLTLLFGLFPNNIQVIGVGWFLGVVFAFYLIFPFFCVLIENKKRAWISLFVSLIINYICGTYFGIGRNNIVYCLCFFIAGGLVYLYRNEIVANKKIIWFILSVISVLFYYFIGANVYTCLSVSVTLLVYAISIEKYSKFISFISGVSMEIYLSHMVVFRGLQRLHVNTMLGNGLVQYTLTVLLVFTLSVCFSIVMQKIIEKNKKCGV